jgi:hypothetical protein
MVACSFKYLYWPSRTTEMVSHTVENNYYPAEGI